jgi:hypothetical protein
MDRVRRLGPAYAAERRAVCGHQCNVLRGPGFHSTRLLSRKVSGMSMLLYIDWAAAATYRRAPHVFFIGRDIAFAKRRDHESCKE